jgi:hypothetical protein
MQNRLTLSPKNKLMVKYSALFHSLQTANSNADNK